MAKRGKRIYENPPKDANLEQLHNWIEDQLSHNQDQAALMMGLYCMGVSPDQYKTFHDAVAQTPAGRLIKEHPQLAKLLIGIGDPSIEEESPFIPNQFARKPFSVPLKDEENKTFKLKLQLAGVTKPPVWREVLVPANYNFFQLNEIIQAVFNWDGSHLWQFEEKAYESDFIVSLPNDDDFDMSPSMFYNAKTTSISSLLKNKGDKLEYLYDFGDDWVVKISLKEILDNKIPNAEVTNYKGDNMVDDIGGVWGYMEYRDFYNNLDKLSKKEKKDFLAGTWFDSEDEFKDFWENLRFDINYTNNLLQDI